MECILRLQLRQVSFEQTRWAKDQDLTSQKKVGMTLEKRWKTGLCGVDGLVFNYRVEPR